jgi:hypothetical protein
VKKDHNKKCQDNNTGFEKYLVTQKLLWFGIESLIKKIRYYLPKNRALSTKQLYNLKTR